MFLVLGQISPHRNAFRVKFVRTNEIYNSGYAQILVKRPVTYFMKINLVFLELLRADVYNEGSMHILKAFVKRSQKKKNLRVQGILKFCLFPVNARIVRLTF